MPPARATPSPESPAVRPEPWRADDEPLPRQLLGDPEMMRHLGGPERPEQIAARHARYPALPDTDRMFRVVDVASGAPVGSVGSWARALRGEPVDETGWFVLPARQGRGIAARATAQAIAPARADGRRRSMRAFPATDNPPSNAICRTLGFTLRGACDFEYPRGHCMRCNDWRLDLRAA